MSKKPGGPAKSRFCGGVRFIELETVDWWQLKIGQSSSAVIDERLGGIERCQGTAVLGNAMRASCRFAGLFIVYW